MKAHLANLFWLVVLLLVVLGVIYAVLPSRPDATAQKAVTDTRLALRQHGFKTDLADFDFSTPPELRAREAILKAIATNRASGPPADQLNLMEIAGNNSAIVVWQQPTVKMQYPSWPDNGSETSWDDLRDILNDNQTKIDAASDAIMSGPIAFNLDASHGNGMLLPHLAVLKNLTETLGSRMVLALHDGNQDAAWTNLLAATRLVTAWNPESAEVCHLVRFGDTKLVFDETWQALQTNHWPDERLARLQAEWEAANLFTNLPEITAFKRASDVAACEQDRGLNLGSRLSFKELFIGSLQFPQGLLDELRYGWERGHYLRHGSYEDETNLLLFYRDREADLRNAIQAPTWAQMRQLPGVTNEVFFQSKYQSRMQAMMNIRRISTAFQRQGASFLGRAAEAEAERRIIITAIALERYRGKHGSYPVTLDMLAPEFLKSVPGDFMDGQPLRYRLADDGHFLLYSVGQDCVDNGGQIPVQLRPNPAGLPPGALRAPPKGDIVWPLPASTADVAALRQKQERAVELRNLSEQQRESEEEWKQSPLRQSRISKILTNEWSSSLGYTNLEIRPVIESVRNSVGSSTNQPSLAELLSLRQITTGGEPEVLTFEAPVSYNAITNRGELTLLVDADPDNGPYWDAGGKVQELERATNGDCLLIWHTIFDPPGPHALQAQLYWLNGHGGDFIAKGPAIPATTSNLCQFSFDSSTYDIELGATFHARLPEKNGLYSIECVTTNGEHLNTLTGSTTNGEFKIIWNLVDDHSHRLTGETFNSIVHITLPDSGRTQTLRGP